MLIFFILGISSFMSLREICEVIMASYLSNRLNNSIMLQIFQRLDAPRNYLNQDVNCLNI